MNCKPGDIAMIVCPPTVQMADQLNGLVLTVVRLEEWPNNEGLVAWEIAPEINLVADKNYYTKDGHRFHKGDRITLTGFPDKYLRPISGPSQRQSVETAKELETT